MAGGDTDEREAAFVALFDAYYDKVLAYATRRLGKDVAEDATADTFVAAWRNLGRVSGDPLLWLYGLAHGAVSNHRRRMLRAARLDERARSVGVRLATPDPSDLVGWEDSWTSAFAALSEADREVLRLTVWEGLGVADGAAVLGCSTVAFKVRLHRARQRLRRYLSADGGAVRLPVRSSTRTLISEEPS